MTPDDAGHDVQRRVIGYVEPSELLADGWLKLPFAAAQDIGAATQAVAGVERLAGRSRSTYARLERISEASLLPVRSLQRHLPEAVDARYLTRKREGRRTLTYGLTEKALRCWYGGNQFGRLPLFVGDLDLPWSARLLYSFLVSWAGLEEARNVDEPLWLSWRFMSDKTSLSRASVARSLVQLNSVDLVYQNQHTEGEKNCYFLTRSMFIAPPSQNGDFNQSQSGDFKRPLTVTPPSQSGI